MERLRFGLCLVVFAVLAVTCPFSGVAGAQEADDTETSPQEADTSSAPPADTTAAGDGFGGSQDTAEDGSIGLAEITGDNEAAGDDAPTADQAQDDAPSAVSTKQSAGRESTQVAEPLCAVEGEVSVDDGSSGTVVVVDDTSLEANEELLAHIAALDDGNSGAGSSARLGKLPKVPAQSSRAGKLPIPGAQVDIDAVVELLREIAAEEEAAAEAAADAAAGAAAEGCQVEYVCGAERVDDIIAGRIDSEGPGAYADYVAEVAGALDVATATIRAVESNPVLSNGEVAPVIPVPSGPEGIQSLRTVLAERGLGEEPEGFFVPVFNYCRIGADGPIEIDVDAPEITRPTFTWTPLIDEFDYPGASDDLVDRITRTLNGRLPQIQTIPPMDTGVAIVQFPTWLWVEDTITFTELEAISELGTVRVRGRATLIDITWRLGDHEITCTLDQMRAFVPGGNPTEDIPECHHIFTELVDYTMTATANYLIEEDVANRLSPDYAWPPDNWRPHPRTPFVGITSTSPPMRVCGIGVVNVAFDADVSELEAFCGDG